jgi:hypothetical protein
MTPYQACQDEEREVMKEGPRLGGPRTGPRRRIGLLTSDANHVGITVPCLELP